ncbi:MAG: RNA methyltransferase [Clostridiales bacterium]|jgi:TrmH family RNA methyltransferase|nr:RNA methyltransferase [Clostridiales bacterium]
MDNNVITSAANKFVRECSALKSRKNRRALRKFIVEGERFVMTAAAVCPPEYIMVSETYAGRTPDPASTRVVRGALFKEISGTETPQGILAVFRFIDTSAADFIADGFVLILENLRDPGNIGAAIRTAAAAGVCGVIVSRGCADVYGEKEVRASAGTLFGVPFAIDAEIPETTALLKDRGYRVIAAAADGAAPAFAEDLTGAVAVVIGNEANGVTQETRALCDGAIRLPMAGGVESLNAAVAAGIIMYEAFRQRMVMDEIG